MDPSPSECLAALIRDPAVPRPLRTFFGSLRADPAALDTLAETLATLRAPGAMVDARLRARLDALAAPLVAACEAALRAAGHPPAADAASLWALAERLRLGCWVVETPRAPEPVGGVVLLGGLDWAEFPELAAPEPPPSGVRVAGSPRATRWSVFVGLQPEPVRPHLETLRRYLDAAGLVGARATAGGWSQRHHFEFLHGPPLFFTARAWGDVQSALTGQGDYLDWYP